MVKMKETLKLIAELSDSSAYAFMYINKESFAYIRDQILNYIQSNYDQCPFNGLKLDKDFITDYSYDGLYGDVWFRVSGKSLKELSTNAVKIRCGILHSLHALAVEIKDTESVEIIDNFRRQFERTN